MTSTTFDPQADAVYLTIGNGKIDRTEDVGPLTLDVGADGKIVGIEIIAASKVLAPGDWMNAPLPGGKQVSAAE